MNNDLFNDLSEALKRFDEILSMKDITLKNCGNLVFFPDKKPTQDLEALCWNLLRDKGIAVVLLQHGECEKALEILSGQHLTINNLELFLEDH